MARTPQQNRVAERRNRTLIEAARTMVLVVKPHFKTLYELFKGRSPNLSFMRPFGCHVTILNILDQLGKFDGKSDEGIFVGYSTISKAFRVYNIRTRKVKKNLHITFLENKPMISGGGPEWIFDIDAISKSMNYAPVPAGTNSNDFTGKGASFDAALDGHNKDKHGPSQESKSDNQKRPNAESSTKTINTVRPVNTATPTFADYPNDPLMPHLKDDEIVDDAYDDRDKGAEADYNNLETVILVSHIPSTKIHKDHPKEEIIREVNSIVQTKKMAKQNEAGLISFINKQRRTNYKDFQNCLFACFLPQMEPKKGHRQEEGIDYDEVFAPVARIEAISQPPGFVDPEFPDRVYKVEKALYGLHQAPRAWPDIMFAVCAYSRFQVQLKLSHMHAVKRIFRYLKGQPTLGLWYPKDSTLELTSYFDSDYAEYIASYNCCGQVLWLQNQLLDYGYNFMQIKIHVDNESAICVVKNHVYHSKTKHIEIRYHFIRDSYEKRLIEMVKIHTDYNVADLLTKAFDVTRFQFLIASIGAAGYTFWILRIECKSGQVMKMGLKFKAYLINDAYADLVQHAGQTATGKELSNSLIASSLPKTTLPTQLSTMASVIICLANNQKFNFSKYILDNLKKNLEVGVPFYMFLTACIKQFWTTLKIKIVNDDVRLQALIDGKKVVITGASIRHDLKLNDAEGTSCLPNAVIFEELARMGYEKPSEKLTFYKAFFLPQWKFFIHTILQCLSVKTTSCNEFRALWHLYLCQPLSYKKVFANMKRVGTGFSGAAVPLFGTMMVQAVEEVGNLPTAVQDTPIPDAPSSSQSQIKHKPGRKERKETKVSPTELHTEEHVPTTSNDLLPSGEDHMQLKELMVLCINLSNKVLDLENEVIEMKYSHKAKIAELESRVEKLEEENVSLTKELKSFNTKVESLAFKETFMDKEKSSKQRRKITDIDDDAEVNLENVYNLDMAHKETVLSMQDVTGADGDGKAFAEELVEVITTTKIIVNEVSTTGGELNAANEEPVSVDPTNITSAQPSEATKTTVEITTAPKAKRIVFHDMEESTTRTTSLKSQVKDKGKAKLVEEPEVLKSRKAHIAIDEEVARRIEAEWNADMKDNIDWNKVVEQVQSRQSDAVRKYQALKRKHVSVAQARKNMMIYLKNMAGFKMEFSKGMSYEEIRPLFEEEYNKDNAEKQKLEEQQEAKELKRNLEIVPDDEDDVSVNVAPLSFKPPTIVDYNIYKEGKKEHFQIIRANGVNMVRSMWLFKHKFHADGILSRYKTRLVANGSSQQLGVDLDETFSLVVKPAIVHTVLSLFVSHLYMDLNKHHVLGFSGLQVMPHELDFIMVAVIPHCLSIDRVRRLLTYVDDIILTASCPALLYQIIGLFLSQKKYALPLLERAHMVTCDPSRTPIDIESKLGPKGCPSTRMSTSGYCVFLRDNLLSWSAKRQHTISRSSAEAEYRGIANVVAETALVRNLLRELHSSLMTATLVYCDNVSVVYMSANPVQHQRTKHVEIDIHSLRDMVTAGHVRVLHVSSRFQYADIFTKGLPFALFEDFRPSLSVRPPFALTAGAY
uniref:Ribonuclease H-like domain-containing protein n=1 Tax=Tanacetum cinerariifolium TaxID=118510 RepID=A0A6L2JA65_TANCI|nr:ribonuclease H-like domain-containing protein [Tanacetum cinerariifolium]